MNRNQPGAKRCLPMLASLKLVPWRISAANNIADQAHGPGSVA